MCVNPERLWNYFRHLFPNLDYVLYYYLLYYITVVDNSISQSLRRRQIIPIDDDFTSSRKFVLNQLILIL